MISGLHQHTETFFFLSLSLSLSVAWQEKAETPLSCPAIQVYFKAPDFTPSGNSIESVKVQNVAGYVKSTTVTKAVAGKFFVRP